MIPPGREDELDVTAVARDDALLDRLARREHLSGDDDVVARLLAAYAASIDEELPDPFASPERDLPDLAVGDSVTQLQPGRETRRRRSARAGMVAVVIGATLSVGGVSAAVTGDPLSAYHSVARALGVERELPPHAAEVAQINRKVLHLRRSLRAGTATPAQLAALRAEVATADIPAGRRDALLRKLDRLAADAAGGTPAATPTPGQQGHGSEDKAAKPDRPDNAGSGRSGAQPTPEPERTSGAGNGDNGEEPDQPGKADGKTKQPKQPEPSPRPEQSDQGQSDQGQPDQGQPDQGQPDQGEPGAPANSGGQQGGGRKSPEPAAPQPDAAQPDAAQSNAGQPEPPGPSDQGKGDPRR